MAYLLVAVAALMFGLYNVFIKLSANHIEAVLGAVVLQFVAAFFGLALLLYMKSSGTVIYSSNKGLLLATLAGLAIGLVEILTFYIFARGVPVAVGNPSIVGGSLLVTTGVGYVLLREHLSLTQLLAIGLIASGVALLGWSAAR
ncbi:EamA family transporter [Nitrosococcus watsonii]|uniref:Uncharacterized protein n=1 Tax=Nitrosococcus watsoni (strain C-113) TaxID=105559 RepID=D8K5R8_NITWC|nr:EamA family transporter [Nitrosococcus watsonii]ADJ28245.1 conserved hypothetical protein [Nitrosococcus watsonii C-113]